MKKGKNNLSSACIAKLEFTILCNAERHFKHDFHSIRAVIASVKREFIIILSGKGSMSRQEIQILKVMMVVVFIVI
jgi:hypothetical protein